MDTGCTPSLAIDHHRSLLAADVAGDFSFDPGVRGSVAHVYSTMAWSGGTSRGDRHALDTGLRQRSPPKEIGDACWPVTLGLFLNNSVGVRGAKPAEKESWVDLTRPDPDFFQLRKFQRRLDREPRAPSHVKVTDVQTVKFGEIEFAARIESQSPQGKEAEKTAAG